MVALIEKIAAIIVMNLSTAWYMHDKGIEPIITLFTSFVTYLLLEYRQLRKKGSYDKALFEKFLRELPSNGAISYITSHDLTYPFINNSLDELHDFARYWENAEHEFKDKKLNKLLNKLKINISNLLTVLARNTWPVGENVQAIPAEWPEDQPERFNNVSEQILTYRKAIIQTHQEIVRLGKKKLSD